ncbi:MAG: hypothetical protein IH905_05095 [Proteobacteria bacterium]|nr:hypothetical protein [Pseudomonadota bacterium]
MEQRTLAPLIVESDRQTQILERQVMEIGGKQLSPSLDSLVTKLRDVGDVDAAQVVSTLLVIHPEYGNKLGGEIGPTL